MWSSRGYDLSSWKAVLRKKQLLNALQVLSQPILSSWIHISPAYTEEADGMVWWMVLSENIQAHLITGLVVMKSTRFYLSKGDSGAYIHFFFNKPTSFGISNWDGRWKARCWDEKLVNYNISAHFFRFSDNLFLSTGHFLYDIPLHCQFPNWKDSKEPHALVISSRRKQINFQS